MNLVIQPVTQLRGAIDLPASKSYSIRAFLTAACGGYSRIVRPSDCDDALAAMRAAAQLGAVIRPKPSQIFEVNASTRKRLPPAINVQESGTVLRLILPLLALRRQRIKVKGEGTLKGRPNTFLIETLRAMGAQIRGQGKQQSVPIEIQGGTLSGGRIAIDGSLSSQFISALLMACPRLKEDTRLRLTGRKLVSGDYITMTLKILELSGIKIRKLNERNYFIPGRQTFHGLGTFQVPSDYGLAAFHLAAAALVRSHVRLQGFFRKDFVQADAHILSFLRRMGVRFTQTNREIRIRGPFVLKGGNFSLRDCPDLVPVMAVLALFAAGKTRLSGIGHARAKESDRISDLRAELLKIGARVEEKKDELTILPQKHYKTGQTLDPRHDHRLAMAFSVLGLKIGARVKDMECTHKSYPEFARDLKLLGAKYRRG